MKETNKTGTRFISCVLAVMMVVTTLTGILPTTVSAVTESDVGSEMWSNVYLDALAYTGYPIDTLRSKGYLFDTDYIASKGYNAGYKSDIPGNYSTTPATGIEMVTSSSTTTGYAPDLATFETKGFQCGSYVTYVLYNYLKNIKGFDVEEEWGWTKPSGYVDPGNYKTAALEWYAAGNADILTLGDDYTQTRVNSSDATKGYNFVLNTGVEVPIGSLLLFEQVDENGNTSGTIAHIAIYAGEYDGKHFITHVGSSRGPEINCIEYMSIADSADGKLGMAELVTMIVIPPTSPEEEYGEINVNKTDENGSGLSGATFTATNTSTGDTYTIGPTDSSGYATSDDVLPYGTYTVTETTMPSGYTVKDDDDPWTVTVSDSTPTVTINASNNGTGTLTIRKLDDSGNTITTAKFTLTSTSYSGYSQTVTTSGSGATASFYSIPFGTYKLTESYVPDGYEASSEDPWTVTVSNSGITIKSSSGSTVATTTSKSLSYAVTNTSIYGSIAVYKTAAEDGSNLSGAYFTATNKSTGDTYSIGPTNSSGYAINSEIPYGTYTVTETTMPSGYTEKDADDPWTVTVSSSNSAVTINAEDTGYGTITINKVDNSGSALSGATFTATNKSTGTKYTGTTNSSGVATIKVPYGSYTVTESTVPTGYTKDEDDPWTVTVSKSSTTASLTISATNYIGSIEVYKTAAEDGSNLSGAYFTATNTSTGKTYSIGPTNSSGYAINSSIPLGTYTVTETTFPTGYTEADASDPWTITLTRTSSTATINAEDASNDALPLGVYTVTETTLPSGYTRDSACHTAPPPSHLKFS
ncbi:MAG: hypothetical protein LUG88_06035 [Clostridia bacterium]|nr:hypothetical protein [Clostridia bacterium]